jgi:parallel beta helix pectate lyase-like protein
VYCVSLFSTSATFSSGSINNVGGDGIYVSQFNNQGGVIIGVAISDSNGYGAYVNGDHGTGKTLWISECVFTRNGNSNNRPGLYISQSYNHVVIDRCTFEDNGACVHTAVEKV